MLLSPGTRLGPYEVVSPLGAGGMGEVYRARDPRLGRDVAVKVLPASVSADPDRLHRFELEAKAASLLNHPHILAIYDVGTHDGKPYVVSELLEGETLRESLGTPLPSRKAVEYALQIAQGIAAAHEKGIAHRDLKPENLFVTNDGRIKILDFGLAKLRHPASSGVPETDSPTLSRGTDPGTVMGSVGYMSPEQVRGRAADPRSDIFSFGAIFYEMLTGRRAFKGETPADTLTAILKEEPPEVSDIRPSVSPALARIVRHCLEKNAEARFQSARDVAFDLEALAETSGIAGLGPAPTPPRQRWLLPMAGVLVLLAGGMLGLGTGKALWQKPLPIFKRLTSRRGALLGSFFTSDGRTVVYSAAWDGEPPELFSMRVDSPESRSLGLPPARLLSVSAQGELAILLTPPGNANWNVKGTLARVPLSGGVARPILEDVYTADWSPDGKDLAVVRDVGGQAQLEYPIGNVLKRPVRGYARVAPQGDRVVFRRVGQVSVFDRSGHETPLQLPPVVAGLAWSPEGDAIWVSAGDTLRNLGLWRASLDGKAREVFRMAGTMNLQDVSKDGRMLITHGLGREGVRARPAGAPGELEVGAFDWSAAFDLTKDGTRVLLHENRGSSLAGGVFMRSTRGGAPVRLGEGFPLALSPDGKWVLVASGDLLKHPRLTLAPTGPGESRGLPVDRFERVRSGWFAGPDDFILEAGEPGRPDRTFVMDLHSGESRAVTPEGVSPAWYSDRDGSIIGYAPDRTLARYPLAGGNPQPIAVRLPRGATASRLSMDGRSLLISDTSVPLHVERLDLTTGRRTLWKVLQPDDAAGVTYMHFLHITPDERTYAYTYGRFLQELYLVEGLR